MTEECIAAPNSLSNLSQPTVHKTGRKRKWEKENVTNVKGIGGRLG